MGIEDGGGGGGGGSSKPLEQHEDNNDSVLDRAASGISVATSTSPLSPRSSLDLSGNTPQWSMMSASPHHGMMSTQLSFPDYDPARIPSSVFSSKPSMAGDWSVASNESLFSIHMGNSGSFCRDERKSDFSSSLPPLVEVSADHEGKSRNMSGEGSQVQEEEEEEVETPKSIPKQTSEEDEEKEKGKESVAGVPQIDSTGRLSTGSANSTKSFAFPVLVKDCSRREGLLKGEKGLKEEPESPPETAAKPETSKEIMPEAAAAQSGCFNCFSCWPRCC